MGGRGAFLFTELNEDKAQIVLPAIVVAEYLGPIPPEQQSEVTAAISERFIVVPFDLRSAAISARLFEEGKAQLPPGKPGARRQLKADAMIIATAVAHGAREFYSEDEACLRLAGTVVEAKRLPNAAGGHRALLHGRREVEQVSRLILFVSRLVAGILILFNPKCRSGDQVSKTGTLTYLGTSKLPSRSAESSCR